MWYCFNETQRSLLVWTELFAEVWHINSSQFLDDWKFSFRDIIEIMFCLKTLGFVVINTAGTSHSKYSLLVPRRRQQSVEKVGKMTRFVGWGGLLLPDKKVSSYTCNMNIVTYCRNVDVIRTAYVHVFTSKQTKQGPSHHDPVVINSNGL